MTKVFQLAKDSGRDSKDVLTALKEAGILVKTPVSVIPEESLEKAKALFPAVQKEQARMTDVVIPKPEKHVDKPTVSKLKQQPINDLPAEGLEPRFSQYVMGLRRRVEGNKRVFSVLTVAFDPANLEMKLLKEDYKRTEAEAVLELRMEMVKRKVV